MQLQPHLTHPFHEGGQHEMGLGLADAVHHHVVHVALELDPVELLDRAPARALEESAGPALPESRLPPDPVLRRH
jgi:hypothetical protein